MIRTLRNTIFCHTNGLSLNSLLKRGFGKVRKSDLNNGTWIEQRWWQRTSVNILFRIQLRNRIMVKTIREGLYEKWNSKIWMWKIIG